MTTERVNPQSTALLIVDLQNDFLHPEGAYGRAGQVAKQITEGLHSAHEVGKSVSQLINCLWLKDKHHILEQS